MRLITLDNYEINVSRDMLKTHTTSMAQPLFEIPKHMINRSRIRVDSFYYFVTFGLDRWLEEVTNGLYNHGKIRILHAHGGMNDAWRYVNGQKLFPNSPKIEDWIEKWENEYEALIVLSCNMGKIKIPPRKKPIVYPTELIDSNDLREAIKNNHLGREFNLSLPKD